MADGDFGMEETDRVFIKELLDSRLEPLIRDQGEIKDRLNKLPCGTIGTRLTKIETREETRAVNGAQRAKDNYRSKDWLLKVALAAVVILTFLQGIGFFQSLAKGK